MKRQLFLVAGTAVITSLATWRLTALYSPGDSSVSPESERTRARIVSSEASPIPRGMSLGGELPIWQTTTESQRYSLSEWRDVTIVDSVQNNNGAWSSYSYAHSTSFDVTATGWSKKDHLLFAGQAANGDTVLEKWKLRVVSTPKTPQSGGVPNKVPLRTEIYRGTEIGRPIATLGDPEGRFVILLAGIGASCKLYSMPVQANATPVVLYSTSPAFPLEKMRFMHRYQHAGLGRVWVLWMAPEISPAGQLIENTAIVLVDSQNDGLFDNTIVDDKSILHETGVLGMDTVLESFERG